MEMKDMLRHSGRRRRAKKHGAHGSFTEEEWEMMLDIYGRKCLCCNRAGLGMCRDHVVPLSRGGSDDITNIQPICASCNAKKRDNEIDYRPFPFPSPPVDSEVETLQMAYDNTFREACDAWREMRAARLRARELSAQERVLEKLLQARKQEAKLRFMAQLRSLAEELCDPK